MQMTSPTGRTLAKKERGASPLPLSVVHAEALYRPRPPGGYDDDGYPFEDAKLSESTAHDDVLSDVRNAAIALVFDQADAMVQRNLLILFEEATRCRDVAVKPTLYRDLGATEFGSPTSAPGSAGRSRVSRCPT